MAEMTDVQRYEFLTDVRVAVLVIERSDKGPLCAPVWYRYVDGTFEVTMEDDSAKAVLLRRSGRASICVQDESPPYSYVTVEGSVTVESLAGPRRHNLILEMATRYLGDEAGRHYAEGFSPDDDSGALMTLRPRRWQTAMY